MKLSEWKKYLQNKKEHYDISDDFVKAYQQSPSSYEGYTHYAWKIGKVVHMESAEPNQKWHFFESYISRNEKINLNDDAKKIYNQIKCPELLLWIAEACNVEKKIIKTASIEAKKIIERNEKQARNKAGIKIRKQIPWEMIEAKIQEDIESELTNANDKIDVECIICEFEKQHRKRELSKKARRFIAIAIVLLVLIIGGSFTLSLSKYLVYLWVMIVIIEITIFYHMTNLVNEESYPLYTKEDLSNIKNMLSKKGVNNDRSLLQLKDVLLNRISQVGKYDNSWKFIIVTFIVPIILPYLGERLKHISVVILILVLIIILVIIGMFITSLLCVIEIRLGKKVSVTWELICAIDEIILMEIVGKSVDHYENYC